MSYYYNYPGVAVKRRRVVGGWSRPGPISVPVQNVHHHNVLLELCRSNAWGAALQRWRSFPQEASPIRVPPWCLRKQKQGGNNPSELNGSFSKLEDESSLLYYPSVMGTICSSRSLGTMDEPSSSMIRILLEEILDQSPAQVACSQVSPQQVADRSVPLQQGNTPLRDAILNPCCPVDILKMLLKADQENFRRQQNEYFVSASHLQDSLLLSPLDHLIQRLQSDISTTATASSSVKMLETFLQMRPPAPSQKASSRTDETTKNSVKVSPLLRLLAAVDPVKETSGFHKIEEIIQCLLRQEPELLYVCSHATGCSPLHTAARTCNFLPIIQQLVLADARKQLIGLENDNGDLPIHIVCSSGVDLDVLRSLATKTAEHDRQLLWTATRFGYTPADLLWLNHIEAGSSFVKVRTFHAKYTVTQDRFKKDNEYYEQVLRASVNDVINGDDSEHATTTSQRMERAMESFSGLLDRLFALLSAFSSKGTEGLPWNDGKYLHRACMVCTPYRHTLAMPLLKLLLWIFEDDLLKVDESGNLPLHHVFCNSFLPESTEEQEDAIVNQWVEWTEFCRELIIAVPASCGIVNQNGQLPLHLLLSNHPPGPNAVSQQMHQELIDKVAQAFPESVYTRDPVSSLDPFMLASVADDHPLDTIYKLLRRCPNLCHTNGRTDL